MINQTMTENNLLEDIRSTCRVCEECDPCCISYILKKCIERKKFPNIIIYKKTGNAQRDFKI